jgi:hypothetical protein
MMNTKEITELGEATAKAAIRANKNGDRAGSDQNRGQFVAMVENALTAIPENLRGEYAQFFLVHHATSAHPDN